MDRRRRAQARSARTATARRAPKKEARAETRADRSRSSLPNSPRVEAVIEQRWCAGCQAERSHTRRGGHIFMDVVVPYTWECERSLWHPRRPPYRRAFAEPYPDDDGEQCAASIDNGQHKPLAYASPLTRKRYRG